MDQSELESVDISSLIDVCFLLLIFFLVTATIAPRESDLSWRLPCSLAYAIDRPLMDLTVSVAASGDVVIHSGGQVEVLDSNIDERCLAGLEERLQIMIAAVGEERVLVHVNADDEASHQRVIDVMDCLTKNAIKMITFS